MNIVIEVEGAGSTCVGADGQKKGSNVAEAIGTSCRDFRKRDSRGIHDDGGTL